MVVSGLASLEASDIEHLRSRRRELLEGFFEDIAGGLTPEEFWSVSDNQLLSRNRKYKSGFPETVRNINDAARADMKKEMQESIASNGLKNKLVCVNNCLHFEFTMYEVLG